MTDFRRSFERRVGPLVVLLDKMPRFVPFLVVAALLIGGLVLQGVLGGLLLLVVAAILGSLLLLSWPVLQPNARVLRLAVAALVALRGISFLVE